MSSTVKKLLQKFLILAFVFTGLNFIYGLTFWYKDVNEHSDTLENLWPHEETADVIYFGESSNFYQEHPDTPKIRISDFVNKMLPDIKVAAVDNAGLVASNYLHIMQHIPSHSPAHTLIVTMNLRSFGPTWIYDENSNYLKKADALIQSGPKLFNRFLIALKAYTPLNHEKRNELKAEAWNSALKFPFELRYSSLASWNNAMANGGHIKSNGKWDMEKIDLACHHIKNYAFNIDTLNNPRIKDFDAIVEYAEKKKWRVVFHILSENIEEAELLVGKSLGKIMTYNKKLLVERYKAKGIMVIDNFRTVPEKHFRDRKFPTEHYNNLGKRLCAKVITDSLKSLLPPNF